MRTNITLALLLILSFISNDTFAQCLDNGVTNGGIPCTITTAVPFLRISPDARSSAFGDAGIALSADANAMALNASKLVFAENPSGLSITYTPWMKSIGVEDVFLSYLAGYYQLDKNQAIGASMRYFSLGEIKFTDIAGESLGTGSPREFELALAYARKMSKKFSASLTAKYIFSDLASTQMTPSGVDIKAGKSGAVDIGVSYVTPINMGDKDTDLRLGMVISNIGAKLTYTEDRDKNFIPTNLGIGAAWEINIDEFNQITFLTDINKLLVPSPSDDDTDGDGTGDGIPDYRQKSPIEGIFSSFSDAPDGGKQELREITYSVGLEYWYDKQFAFRTGYFYEHPVAGGRKYFTLGVGIKYNIFGLNFSYLVPTSNQRNPLDNTLRFSLLFDFAGNNDVE